MYEYQVRNIRTGEQGILFGYSWQDALRRAGVEDEKDLRCWRVDYID